jgi:hypothetical protein
VGVIEFDGLSSDEQELFLQKSLDDWVQATLPRAISCARALLHDPVAADDVVQECYIRLIQRADRYDLLQVRWSWGRDADGVIWLTSNPQRGLRIAPDEQGPGLLWMAELYGLRPETLLSQILAHCRLHEDARTGSNVARVIHAEPRVSARQVWLRSVTLELDSETKAVRKLTLKRANKSGNTTIVTFTLIDTRPVEHARYGLDGNLVEPFQIYDRDFQPGRRREILARWLGLNVDAWILPSAKN